MKLAEQLTQWYQTYGSKRAGNYQLTRGGWLDRLQRIFRDLEMIELSRTDYSKPTMALWGPSQSGKSTLLQAFIDGNSPEEEGCPALTWSENDQARFCGRSGIPGLTVLNPYNHGLDASGCVTRFQLKDEVPYPEYPVELKFSTDFDIMLSLAVGYLSETTAQNKAGEKINISAIDLRHKLPKKPDNDKESVVDEQAYNLLVKLCDVLETLIDMNYSRYLNLQAEWSNLRREVLNNTQLSASMSRVKQLVFDLLWDDWSNIDTLFESLLEMRGKLMEGVGHDKIYCPWSVASIMLDIAAVKRVSVSEADRTIVSSLGFSELSDGVKALTTTAESKLFVQSGTMQQDFALMQGLVSLIVVPIRGEAIKANSETVHSVLEVADLLDFPGVSNEHRAATLLEDDKLDFNYIADDGSKPYIGLTQLMKRGKTASIVVSSSRNLNIDVFSLLVRMPAGQNYPAQPHQLLNGIKSWCKAMGSQFPPTENDAKLPINLTLTFSASLINEVDVAGTGVSGLHGVFSRLDKLGNLADSNFVRTFTTNYPQFSAGTINCDSDERLVRNIQDIAADENFKKYFSGSPETLYAMAGLCYGERQYQREFGGRLYFFEQVREQLESSKRRDLLDVKYAQLTAALHSCLIEALPPKDEQGQRAADIQKLIAAIQIPDQDSPGYERYDAESIGCEIINFKNIDAEILDILPLAPNSIPSYTEAQVALWRDCVMSAPLQSHMGFESEEHRSRVISYIITNIDLEPLVMWLRGFAPTQVNQELREEFRRLVAAFLTQILFEYRAEDAVSSSAKCSPQEAQRRLNAMSQYRVNNPTESPHYFAILKPFLDYLDYLLCHDALNPRGIQCGDSELEAITQDHELSIERH